MLTSLTIVTWRWRGNKLPPADAVVTLRNMVQRHYKQPHRFLCVDDHPEELDPSIETVPDWGDFTDLPALAGADHPSCYRRLRAFHPAIGETFGPRFVSLDLDTVICGDVTGLWSCTEDFRIFGDTNPKTFYNGSMFILTAGARTRVWTEFDPKTSPRLAWKAGHHGSDQAWISFCLGKGEAKWNKQHGVYSFRNELQQQNYLPSDAKVVSFHGRKDPWADHVKQKYPWVAEHYR